MTDKNKYDPMGELFRRKMESHQIPVDSNSWDEIERRLDKSKNKAVMWLWRCGTVAAAATVAALLIVHRPAIPKTAVSQQITSGKAELANNEVILAGQKIVDANQIDIVMPANEPVNNGTYIAEVFQTLNTDVAERNTDATGHIELLKPDETENTEIPITEQNEIFISEAEQDTEKFDIQLATAFEEEFNVKKEKKWLFAAAIGIGGSQSENFANQTASTQTSNVPDKFQSFGSKSSGNQYANDLSASIPSFNYIDKNNFTNISHMPPLSFGIMAHLLGEGVGIESGLIYTFLESQFEWSDWASYRASQRLHYIGIPVNLVIYVWNSNPDWRIYLSGGFTVEKGLRAIFQQESRGGGRETNTTVRSSIDGVQWSTNGALGVNYKFEKRLGVYFESRFGHSFDNNQPISIRTERPFFVGIGMGINYEL